MNTCIIVGAGGRGKDSYAPYIKENGLMKIIGVAEPDDQKRSMFQTEYDIADDMCFADYRSLFERERLADAVIICTQDRMHSEPAVLAMKRGYHILLEKPIAPKEDEILKLKSLVSGYNKVFMTGFVLRYTPFITKIKSLLDIGEIGDIVTMQLNENEGFWHHAHSYVRGQWNNDRRASPLIVAKSCHDFDIMLYLTGLKCRRLSSYGSNTLFKLSNAPGKVPERCTDGCEFSDVCEYNAVRQYTEGGGRYFVNKIGCPDDKKAITDMLKTSEYGRCVYRCDNNVCDHQVVSIEFENGVTAVFTVSAFSLENTRTLKIMGTRGELGGCMEKGKIVLKKFTDMTEKEFYITHDNTKHCGGDGGIVRYFADIIRRGIVRNDMSIFDSHIMAFAAERSRKEQRCIEL